MTELPPAAPRRQRAVWAARRVTRPPAPGTSAVEQRRSRAEPAHKASGGDDARHTTGWPARPFFVNYPHPPERQTSSGRNRSYSAAGAVLSLIEPSGSLDRAAFSAIVRSKLDLLASWPHARCRLRNRFEGSLSGLSDGIPTGRYQVPPVWLPLSCSLCEKTARVHSADATVQPPPLGQSLVRGAGGAVERERGPG